MKNRSWGKEYAVIEISGDTFDDCFKAANKFCMEKGSIFVHAFDDVKIIEGQATMAIEILEDI